MKKLLFTITLAFIFSMLLKYFLLHFDSLAATGMAFFTSFGVVTSSIAAHNVVDIARMLISEKI